MHLEKPQLHSTESLKERVTALEHYLFRLVGELEQILKILQEKEEKHG